LYDRRHADVYEEWLELLGDPDAAEDAAQWALLSAAEGVEEDEVSRLVHAALPDLPVAARTALLLREREGLGYAEVAKRLGVAQPTAERVVYVARMRLVEALNRIRQALTLAPLLGWLKSVAGALTLGKGVAAVAALGAAAGLSAAAIADPAPDPAPAPVAPQRALPASIEPVQVQVPRPAAPAQTSLPRATRPVTPVTAQPGEIAPAPAPGPAAPAAEPAPTSVAQPESPQTPPPAEPVVLPVPAVPAPVEAPVEPVAVETPKLPLDVPLPELELPPLPLP
jgi:transcriptional regulator with XRE-family HTH domain